MKELLALAVMGVIVMSIWPDPEKNYVDVSSIPQYNWRNEPQPKQASKKSVVKVAPAKASAKAWVINAETVSLIKEVGRKYGVPSGALYGIWYVESGLLPNGWGNGSAGWYRAADLVKPDGLCVKMYGVKRGRSKEYGRAWCAKQWRALVQVCAQQKDGQAICDPDEVYTSYALAMGPMQQLPTELVTFNPQGVATWGERVVDYDGDGVRDPHTLKDAMAMSALFLKRNFARSGSWQQAINAYYGSQKTGYMEGTTEGKRGVVDHWKVWCDRYDDCRNGNIAVAIAD